MTDTTTTRLKLGAVFVAALVVLGMGTAAVFASQHESGAGNDATDSQSSQVTAENVEIEQVTMENVSVSNVTVELGELNDTDSFWTSVLQPAAGDNVEGLQVDSVDIGNVEQANIEVENNTATVSAEIESITIEGVSADRVTVDSEQMGNIAQPMLEDGDVSFESVSVEGLSVERISTEATEQPDEANNETEDNETGDNVTVGEGDNETEDNVTVGDNETGDNVTVGEGDNETEDNVTVGDNETGDSETEDNATAGEGDNMSNGQNVTDGEGAEGADEASVTFEDQSSDGMEVTVASVTLPEDGYVAIHNESLFEGEVVGSVVGVSEYLEAGTHENVTVTLYEVPGADFDQSKLTEEQNLTAMPHEESSDNETYDFVETGGEADGAYLADGEPVIENATVSVDG